MLLGKTDKGRTVLESRSDALNARDRRLLILSDGQRSRESLLAMFGADAAESLDRLLREGYLVARAEPGMLSQAAGMLAARLRPERASVPPESAAVAAPATSSATPAPRPAATRRSMAATKMYLLDMLQLQRNEEAASLRAAIHTAPSEDELVWQVLRALRHIRATTSASYGERVSTRLAEILPDPWLPRLHATLAETSDAA